jgi:acyl-CoA reductase-like NAD-dependent aldehyde dehydrogenase
MRRCARTAQGRDPARGIDCDVIKPVSICVGICPYNFPRWCRCDVSARPGHGNTFILKPSEKVPLTGQLLIELHQPGLPKAC